MKIYLGFEKQIRAKDAKTDCWKIWTGGNDFDKDDPYYAELGIIKWWSHWRRYVFSPHDSTIYDPGCLREIADFCEANTQEHRAVRAHEKKREER